MNPYSDPSMGVSQRRGKSGCRREGEEAYGQ
jgi:ribosomal protein L37E